MSKPIARTETGWTALNHQLTVIHWPDSVVFTCRSRGLNLEKGMVYEFVLSQVAIITGNTYSESMRFLMHSLSYYRDEELLAHARTELDKIVAGMQSTADTQGQPDPNAN